MNGAVLLLAIALAVAIAAFVAEAVAYAESRGWYCRGGHRHQSALDADLCNAERYEGGR